MLMGYSTYVTTMIRSNANPAVDMYNVDNPMSLVGYLGREQYGDFPLISAFFSIIIDFNKAILLFTLSIKTAISGFSKTIQIQDSSSSALCTSITGANARNWFTGCNSSGLYGVYDATAGAYRLQIGTTGRVYIPNAYTETTGNSANLFVDTDGRLIRSTSSLKYKQNVQDATHGLAEVIKLRPVTYKGKTDGDTVFGGLIAEEVDEVGLKEFVTYAEDGSPDALAYGNMVSLCVKAIQEQQALITAQAETINALQADVTALKAKVA
jgi:hypothetical protein